MKRMVRTVRTWLAHRWVFDEPAFGSVDASTGDGLPDVDAVDMM
jgi:hypothetical protein